jgi:hypothetical protein
MIVVKVKGGMVIDVLKPGDEDIRVVVYDYDAQHNSILQDVNLGQDEDGAYNAEDW